MEYTPILIIGATGMLGRAWRDARPDARPSDRQHLDLTRPDTLDRIPGDTRTVINCAAWTNVDGAEEHEAEANAINAEGVARLAERCRRIGAMLVHYSTDYVFDGQASTPYPVDTPRKPIGAYGRSKARGEEAIEASGCDYLILRTSWLYAPWGKNFVRTMARLTGEKPSLKVVSDQRGRPTSAKHLARTSLALIDHGARGIYHVTDGGECSWHEFTQAINEQLGHTCDVRPCTTAEYPTPARRPAYSVLDLSKTENILGPMPHWRDNLADVLQRLEPTPV